MPGASGPFRYGDAQRVQIYVWDHANHEPVTGDALNITTRISKNEGAYANTTNSPAELERGWYEVDLTSVEMTAHTIDLIAETSTADCEAHFHPSTIKTMEMSTDGYPGLDWGNLKNKTTITSLGNTSIKDVTDLIEVNVTQVSGDSTAADKLELEYKGRQDHTVDTASFAPIHSGDTTIFESLSNYADDGALIGQVIGWADGTNVGLTATILDFLGTATLGTTRNRYTVSKLPALPASGNEFIIAFSSGAVASVAGSNLTADAGSNFQLFFDNAAAATTKVVDDVGGLTAAQVNTEVDTALTDIGLDHLVFTSVAGTDVADNSVMARMVSSAATADWDTFVNTTDALQAIRDRGDASWTTGTGSGLTPLASGTAQGGSANTIQLAAGESFADDELNGNMIKIIGGTGAGQARRITDHAGSTDTSTVAPDWTTTPDATSTYEIVEGGSLSWEDLYIDHRVKGTMGRKTTVF